MAASSYINGKKLKRGKRDGREIVHCHYSSLAVERCTVGYRDDFLGGKPNDLVVAPSSSTPASIQPSSETTTDHFSYFSEDEMKKPEPPALDFIAAALRTRGSSRS